MAREVKFRAWHSNAQNWVMKCDIPKCFVEEEDYVVFDAPRHIKLSQYTGMKDKHGKDIYEGDILEYKCGGKTWIREVIFQFGAFGTRVENDNISHFFNVLTESETEIIGNIYENPNKLKF